MEITEKRRMAREMRLKGMTFEEIGKELGVSRQRVQQYVMAQYLDGDFRHYIVKPTACRYAGLRNWLNEHGWSMAKLVVEMGYQYNPQAAHTMRNKLTSEEEGGLKLRDIRKILNATGLTFEECFTLE